MTARLYLIRHGRAAAGWGQDLDPGLDDVGRAEAAAVATQLDGVGPLPILTSPLRRARETAAPLAAAWGVDATVEEAVGEIPSPTDDLAERAVWLRDVLAGRWSEMDPAVIAWRSRLRSRLLAVSVDTAVFTHFVAINAIVSEAEQRDDLVVITVANGSCTVVDVDADAGTFTIVQLGTEADTEVR